MGTGPARPWHTIHTGEIAGKSQAVALVVARRPDLANPLASLVESRRTGRALTPDHARAAVDLGRRILAAC